VIIPEVVLSDFALTTTGVRVNVNFSYIQSFAVDKLLAAAEALKRYSDSSR